MVQKKKIQGKKQLSAPATKADLHSFQKEIKNDMNRMGDSLRKEFKNDVNGMGDSLRKEFKSNMSAMEYRILEQMTLLLEHHRADIIGATRDDITHLKTRVTRLEKETGLIAA